MIQWSHSRLQVFKNCPKKFYHLYIAKDVVDDTPPHPTTLHGLEVHKAIEERIKHGIPMPAHLGKYAYVADLAASLPNVQAEVSLAINSAWQPTGWTAPDVWGRCIVDVLSVSDGMAVVGDWKLGKYRGDLGQAAINAFMVMTAFPQVDKVTTKFNYLAANIVDTKDFTRDKFAQTVQPTLDTLRQIEMSSNNKSWAAAPSGLCGYCPVSSCPHHRKRK